MRTGGYDVTIEIKEKLINRALTAMFYSSYMTHFSGNIGLSSDLPMGELTKIKYDLVISEPPILDLLPGDNVRARLSLDALIEIPGGMRIDAVLTATLVAGIMFDLRTGMVTFEVTDVKVDDIHLLRRASIPAPLRTLINRTIKIAIRANIIDRLEKARTLSPIKIPFSSLIKSSDVRFDEDMDVSVLPGILGASLPIPVINLNIAALLPPGMTISDENANLTIAPRLFKVIDPTTLAVTISFQGSEAGDPSAVKDFTDGHDVAIGLSETSLHRILENLWPVIPRTVTQTGSVDVENVKELLDSMKGIYDMPANLNTLGMPQKRTSVERAWVEYSAEIEPDKPNLRLVEGGKIEVYDTHLKVHAKATPKATMVSITTKGRSIFLPTFLEKSKPPSEPEIMKKDTDLTHFDSVVDVLLKKAVAEVMEDKNGQVSIKLSGLDFNIDLPWHLPKSVMKTITTRITGRIENELPTIDLEHMIQERAGAQLPIVPDMHLKKVSSEGSEAVFALDMDFKGTPARTSTVPRYVADVRQTVRLVHRADCPSVLRIDEKDKVGYASLADAISDGMRAADDCLHDADKLLSTEVSGEGPVRLPTVGVQVQAPRAVKNVVSENQRRSIPVKGPEKEAKGVEANVEGAGSQQGIERSEHEMEGKEDEDRPGRAIQYTITTSGQKMLRPIDTETDDEQPSEVANKVDDNEER